MSCLPYLNIVMIYLTKKLKFIGLLTLLCLLVSMANYAHAQSAEIKLSQDYSNLNWSDFVKKVEQDFQLKFFYNEQDFPKLTIAFEESQIAIEKLLNEQLASFGFHISIDKNRNIFISKESISTAVTDNFFENYDKKIATEEEVVYKQDDLNEFIITKKEFIAKEVIIGSKKLGGNKTKAIVSGYVRDAITKEGIVGATVALSDYTVGIATDQRGFFSFQLDKGKHNLLINFMGFKEEKIEAQVLSDGSFEVFLESAAITLNEALVSAQKYARVKGTEMGIEKLSAKSVKEIPLVMGEKDIIKVALLLPGVQSVGEGSSGFNVRGSPTDQNLFYINNLPVYNTSHLSGFFSAFNSDVIDEFALYKGNIPVKYGGRLSSIFEISAKQGNKERYTASGGISPITGRVLFEGPIQKGKSNFVIALRSTYSDWLLKLANDADIRNSKARFADAVTNFTFNISAKDMINVFTYYSTDHMNLADKRSYDYQNLGASVLWRHAFNNNNNFDVSLVHSIYDFSEENQEISIASYAHSNQLKHTEFKTSVNVNSFENHKFNFGLNSVLYNVDRGAYEPLSGGSLIDFTELGTEKALESAIFISDEFELAKALTVSLGLRYNHYVYLGPQEVSKYIPNAPKTADNLVEILHFDNNEVVKSHGGLDWRLAANYLFNKDLSVKMSYNRQHQYIYMLTNSISISPDYKWKLSDYNTEPIVGDQVSAGLFYNTFWGGKNFDLSIEGYYKKTKNLVEIKDGANLIMNEFSEQSTLQGKLDAYGIELMLKKNSGKLSGWINYTYSHSEVVVDSDYPENRINFGNPYLSNYDKPHALNLVLNYRFKRRLSVSANVVYSTGRPITYPTALYLQNGIQTLHYSKRNEYRVPDYFRVDLSISLEGNLKKDKVAHGSWTFSVYNLIGRKNAYSVYFRYEEGKINGYKLSIFGSPIVSITYNFKLGNYAD